MRAATPEQLIAAWSHSAPRLAARRARVNVDGSAVSGRAGIGPQGQPLGLSVTLVIDLPNLDLEQARSLAEAAHQVCPYSKATRGKITVDLQLA